MMHSIPFITLFCLLKFYTLEMGSSGLMRDMRNKPDEHPHHGIQLIVHLFSIWHRLSSCLYFFQKLLRRQQL